MIYQVGTRVCYADDHYGTIVDVYCGSGGYIYEIKEDENYSFGGTKTVFCKEDKISYAPPYKTY